LFNIVYFSELWDQNDEEVARPNFSTTRAPPPRHQFSSAANVAGDGAASADTFPFCLSSLSIAEERSDGEPGEERDEKRARGRRAHFTIGKCAADFSLLNLPKGKSLGRSKPTTNS
jgi:hypothetical protein